MSSKGQIPFIELNGREIADSNFIIAFLEESKDGSGNSRHTDQHLNAKEKADAQAYNALIEQSLFW
jgi:hypothetical protein